MSQQKKKDSIIAAAITFGIALGILLWLFFGGMTFDRATLANVSTAEIQTPEEEELFLEPELLEDLGEPDAEQREEPAPAFRGEPEQAEQENTKLVVPGKSENKTPPVEKQVTQTKPSAVTSTEPPKNEEEKKKVTAKMANKFSGQNGAENGATGKTGAGQAGVGAIGHISGRTYLGCTPPRVELQNKVVVEVRVTINSAGKVTAATARSKSGNASGAILEACRKAAMTAKWNEDKSTPSASGTLTFTITPK